MREKDFLKWTSINLSSKLSLTYGGDVTYYKSVHYPIPTSLLWEQGTQWQFSKQISKLSFQLHVQISSLLTQTEGERNAFFIGCKKEDHIVRLSPRALGCHKRWKVSPFVKFEIILPLLCFLLDPLTNKHCRIWSSMINLWIDSRTCKK